MKSTLISLLWNHLKRRSRSKNLPPTLGAEECIVTLSLSSQVVAIFFPLSLFIFLMLDIFLCQRILWKVSFSAMKICKHFKWDSQPILLRVQLDSRRTNWNVVRLSYSSGILYNFNVMLWWNVHVLLKLGLLPCAMMFGNPLIFFLVQWGFGLIHAHMTIEFIRPKKMVS